MTTKISLSKIKELEASPFPPEPSVILDCFAGTGTTCLVAQRLGRRSVGIDLSESYLQQAVARLSAVALPLPLGA